MPTGEHIPLRGRRLDCHLLALGIDARAGRRPALGGADHHERIVRRARQLRLLRLLAVARDSYHHVLRPLVAGGVLRLDLHPVDAALRRGSSNRHLLRVELESRRQSARGGRHIRLRIVCHPHVGHRFLQFEFRLRDAERVKSVVVNRDEHRRHHIRLESFRHREGQRRIATLVLREVQ